MAMDVMVLPRTPRNNICVLVAVDSFSKWTVAIPMKNKTTATVCNIVESNILPNFTKLPTRILTDNGPEFRSEEFNLLLKKYNINHVCSTPYKPSSNGGVERMNRTIIQLLKSLVEGNNTNWDLHLPRAMVIYNNTVHSQTKQSPSDIILKKSHEPEKVLPIDRSTMKSWRMGNPSFAPFAIGKKVLRKIVKVGNLVADKLKARYEGPFIITKVRSNRVTYEIQRCDKPDSRIIKVHYEQLKEFKEIPSYLKEYILFDDEQMQITSSSDESSEAVPFLGFGNGILDSSVSSDTSAFERTTKSITRTSKHTVTDDHVYDSPNEEQVPAFTNQNLESDNICHESIKITNQESNEDPLADIEMDNISDTFVTPCESCAKATIMSPERTQLCLLPCSEPVWPNTNSGNYVFTSTPQRESFDNVCRINDSVIFKQSIEVGLTEGVQSNVNSDEVQINVTNEAENVDDPIDILEEHSPSLAENFEIIDGNLNQDVEELNSFVHSNEKAWADTTELIEQEITKSRTEQNWGSFTEDVFQGFGINEPDKNVGSAKLNFLNTLLKHSNKNMNHARNFRRRNVENFRRNKDKSSIGETNPELATISDSASNSKQVTSQMITRSRGKPTELSNVQSKILEYRKLILDL